jgi:hypothetical protein
MASVPLSAIQMDRGIQCRVGIDMETVGDYVERINAGERAPAIDLFGTDGCYWIGDGWHRIMAAQQVKASSIDAEIHEGGRQDALKHALRANTQHGLRRTNADKRRCVEIALIEFNTLSSATIAKMCGVDDVFVGKLRDVLIVRTSKVTGADGKQYPAKRREKATPASDPKERFPLKRNTSHADVVQVVKELFTAGNNAEQVSAIIGRGVDTVRAIILKNKLGEMPRRGRNAASISPAHVIRETVNAVVATGHGLKLIRGVPLDLPKAEAKELLAELRDAMKSLGWLVNVLKEKSND